MVLYNKYFNLRQVTNNEGNLCIHHHNLFEINTGATNNEFIVWIEVVTNSRANAPISLSQAMSNDLVHEDRG